MPPPKERLTLTCPSCGSVFDRLECQIRDAAQAFCSKACVGLAKRHGSRLSCAWCRKKFYRRYGEQDIGIAVRQFCSRECYRDWRAEKRTSYPKDGTAAKNLRTAEAAATQGGLFAETLT